MSKNEAYRLKREIEAAVALKEALKVYGDEDPDLVPDSIEGETDLFEMLEGLVLSLDEDEILDQGLKVHIANLQGRKTRLGKRMDSKRAMMLQALQISELSTKEFSVATISTRKIPRSLIIDEESELPTKYFVRPEPTLDKKALKKDLDDGKEIKGASLSNGGIGLTIRRK